MKFLLLFLLSTLPAFAGVEQLSEKEFRALATELAPKVNLFAEAWNQDPEAEFYGGTTRDYLYWLKGKFRGAESREKAQQIARELKALSAIDVRDFIIGESDIDIVSRGNLRLDPNKFGVRKLDTLGREIFDPSTPAGKNEIDQGYIPAEKMRLSRKGFTQSAALGDGVHEIYTGKLSVHFTAPEVFATTKYALEGRNHPVLLAIRFLRLQAINYFQTYGAALPNKRKLFDGMDEKSRAEVKAVIDSVMDGKTLQPFLKNTSFKSWLNGGIQKSYRSYTNPTAANEILHEFGVEKLPAIYPEVEPLNQYVFQKYRDEPKIQKALQESGVDQTKAFSSPHTEFPDGFLYHGTRTEPAFRGILLQGVIPSESGSAGQGLYGVSEADKKFSEKWAQDKERLLRLPVKENAKIVDITHGEGQKLWRAFLAHGGNHSDYDGFCERYGIDLLRYPYEVKAYVVKNSAALGRAEGVYRQILTLSQFLALLPKMKEPGEFVDFIKLNSLSDAEIGQAWKQTSFSREAILKAVQEEKFTGENLRFAMTFDWFKDPAVLEALIEKDIPMSPLFLKKMFTEPGSLPPGAEEKFFAKQTHLHELGILTVENYGTFLSHLAEGATPYEGQREKFLQLARGKMDSRSFYDFSHDAFSHDLELLAKEVRTIPDSDLEMLLARVVERHAKVLEGSEGTAAKFKAIVLTMRERLATRVVSALKNNTALPGNQAITYLADGFFKDLTNPVLGEAIRGLLLQGKMLLPIARVMPEEWLYANLGIMKEAAKNSEARGLQHTLLELYPRLQDKSFGSLRPTVWQNFRNAPGGQLTFYEILKMDPFAQDLIDDPQLMKEILEHVHVSARYEINDFFQKFDLWNKDTALVEKIINLTPEPSRRIFMDFRLNKAKENADVAAKRAIMDSLAASPSLGAQAREFFLRSTFTSPHDILLQEIFLQGLAESADKNELEKIFDAVAMLNRTRENPRVPFTLDAAIQAVQDEGAAQNAATRAKLMPRVMALARSKIKADRHKPIDLFLRYPEQFPDPLPEELIAIPSKEFDLKFLYSVFMQTKFADEIPPSVRRASLTALSRSDGSDVLKILAATSRIPTGDKPVNFDILQNHPLYLDTMERLISSPDSAQETVFAMLRSKLNYRQKMPELMRLKFIELAPLGHVTDIFQKLSTAPSPRALELAFRRIYANGAVDKNAAYELLRQGVQNNPALKNKEHMASLGLQPLSGYPADDYEFFAKRAKAGLPLLPSLSLDPASCATGFAGLVR